MSKLACWALLAALLLVACSGDDDDAKTSTPAPAPTLNASSVTPLARAFKRTAVPNVDRLLELLERRDAAGVMSAVQLLRSPHAQVGGLWVRTCSETLEFQPETVVHRRVQELVSRPYELHAVAYVPDNYLVFGRYAIILVDKTTVSGWSPAWIIVRHDGIVASLSEDCGAQDIAFYYPPVEVFAVAHAQVPPMPFPSRRSGYAPIDRVLDALITGDVAAIDRVLDPIAVQCVAPPPVVSNPVGRARWP